MNRSPTLIPIFQLDDNGFVFSGHEWEFGFAHRGAFMTRLSKCRNLKIPGNGVGHSFYTRFTPRIGAQGTLCEKVKMNKKILIVEDNLDVIYILRRQVTNLGYDTLLATNGREAVITEDWQRVALILLFLHLLPNP